LSRWSDASERYEVLRVVSGAPGPRVRRVLPLESVPNFSEGRDGTTIEAIRAALAAHADVLDVHSDADHNRSVYTLVGDEPELSDALLAAIAVARELIDLRRHEGAHPRIGAADVVPIVPLRADQLGRAKAAAVELGHRIGTELELPVFLYGESAPGRGPAFFRRGGPEELQRRLETGELVPDFGPPRLDARAGAVVVGARRPLIAFNVDLRTSDVEVAREIAAVVRESGGGFPGVRALGLALPRSDRVQVSMNVEDWEAAALHDVVARVEAEAAARGVEVAGSELVGLMPAGAAAAAAGAQLRIDGFDASHVLELRLLDRAVGAS
jgi:glutamate formiminotransferase/glutamate formiminotransferase/formiminotetrahydrofolate cyclodeaminase